MTQPAKDTQQSRGGQRSAWSRLMPSRATLRGLLLALLVWFCWWIPALLLRSPNIITASLGEPAPRSIKAPRQITFVSDYKTQQERLAAARSVEDIYSGRDRDIAREQIRILYDLLEQITAIRQDEALGQASRRSSLAAIDDLASDKLRLDILSLDDDQWQGVMDEALRVLDLVMRDEIRPGALSQARSAVERMTTHTLSDEQYDVVVALVQAKIVSNSHYDAQKTLEARRLAQSQVAPVHHTVMAGQSVLREGEIVNALAIETLDALGLLRKGVEWEDVLGYGVIYALIILAVAVLVVRNSPLLLLRPKREFLFSLVLIAVGISSRLAVPGRTLTPYLLPTAAAAMVVALLLDLNLAIAVAMVGCLLVAFDSGGSATLAAYTLIGGLIGALTLWRMDQIGSFVRVTLYLAISNVAILLAYNLVSHNYDIVGLLQLTGAGLINAVLATSLTFVAFSFIGRIFGIATSLQLLELARPTHPLFRRLLVEAPGTYHHSIVISNMAERAAEAIGADALLARVGSYYHDIGKTMRPYFFSENQSDGENPHDRLDPKTSTDIIIGHVLDGLELARKHNIPERICDFIAEHHGTTSVAYFYRQALQDADGDIVDEGDFRYPGPIPQSKETAIVMLADSIEAWVRAHSPPTQDEMERVIRQVINDRLISGQLDACDLTLSDLDAIRLAFTSVLRGIFHPRIKYPERVVRATRRNGGNNHG